MAGREEIVDYELASLLDLNGVEFKISLYEFESPAQLLEDFYREAEEIMSGRS